MNFGSIKRYVDTSNTSLAVSIVVFVFICLVAKYALDKYNDIKEDSMKNNIYALFIGVFFAMLSLLGYKQVGYSRNGDILNEPFNAKI